MNWSLPYTALYRLRQNTIQIFSANMAPVTIMDMKISPAFPKGILTAVSGRGTAAVDRSLRPRCFSAFQLTISKHPKPSPLF